MKRAVYPGSFDPMTLGHVDLIERGARLFDELVICVGVNPSKSAFLSVTERVDLVTAVAAPYDNVRVCQHEGLIVDLVRSVDASAIFRGLRTAGDLEYETPMALTNRSLLGGTETVFLVADPRYSFISSRLIKEILRGGGDIRAFVPPAVAEHLESARSRLTAGGGGDADS